MRRTNTEKLKKSEGFNYKLHKETIRILENYKNASKSMRLILRDEFDSKSYTHTFWSGVESLCIGVIRYLNSIDFLISRGLKPGMKKFLKANELALLRLGTYETRWLKQSIEVIKKKYPNNILKTLQKIKFIDLDKILRNKPTTNRYSLHYSHPTFFIETIMKNIKHEEALELFQANNTGYPYYVRKNNLLDEPKELNDILHELEVEAKPDSDYPELFQILGGIDRIVASKYFTIGSILIQEKGSVAIIKALNPQSGDTVWDACAAPGQKTQLICEVMDQQGRIIASDIYPNRLQGAKLYTTRLGCRIIDWILTDATRSTVMDANRVLIDAPCTSTGILYSHPSFKWRLNKKSLFSYMSVQNKILDGIVEKYNDSPETEFVYATCSVLPHEGESQIDSVMQKHGIQLLDIPGPGTTGYPGFNCSKKVRRLFPHMHECGGFFFARFKITC